ncbi:MAG: AI-2E family transporter [Rhodobacteraceae bacterium]|nr:AI-2E family transporter [Paracoccaceae bacterium]
MSEKDRNVPGRPQPNWATIGIFLILGFAALALARDFLMPLSMGVLLFFVFSPVCRVLVRLRMPRPLAAALITAGLLTLLAGAVAVLAVPLTDAVNNAPRIFNRIQYKLEQIRDPVDELKNVAKGLDELSRGKPKAEPAPPAPPPDAAGVQLPPKETAQDNADKAADAKDTADAKPDGEAAPAPQQPQQPQQPPQPPDTESGLNWLTQIASTTPGLLAQLVFTLFLLYFMLASGDLLYRRVVESFSGFRDKRRALEAMYSIENSLGSYLGTITLINVGLGVAVGLTMWAWNMPQPALFGVVAFAFNFIPYVGAIAGVLLSTAVAFVTMSDFLNPALVGLSYMGLTTLEGNLITPSLVSRRLRLNTVVVFVAVALWAWLWSVVGMVVAVPMLVVLRVLCEHIPQLSGLGKFLAGDAISWSRTQPGDEEDGTEHRPDGQSRLHRSGAGSI